jgi:hypothetical protein
MTSVRAPKGTGTLVKSLMEFRRRPSTAAFMARALCRWPGSGKGGSVPPIRARWTQHRVDRRQLAEFLRLTGLPAREELPLLYPHVFGFPLLMVVVTRRAFPMPIWGALQIRNHLMQHRAIPETAVVDLDTGVIAQRIVEKGIEVDLHTTVSSRGELLWESVNTFYYRGRFGETGAASPMARAPEVGDTVAARWRTSSAGGWRFGGLTGDYNGIHWSDRYARRFGFEGAFHHPQRVLCQCMAHLPAPGPGQAQRLDAWLKGPVYYDADVELRVRSDEDGPVFALLPAGEQRPAIIGRWRSVPAGSRLLGEQAATVQEGAS